MTRMTINISLYVDAEATPDEILEKVQWAINGACSKLEDYLPKHENISYAIGNTASEI